MSRALFGTDVNVSGLAMQLDRNWQSLHSILDQARCLI